MLGPQEAGPLDFFGLFWPKATRLYLKNLPKLLNWLSLVRIAQSSLGHLEAGSLDFFRLFWPKATTMCRKNFPELKENL